MNSQPRSYLQSSKSSNVHFTTQGASTASTSELSDGDGKTRRNRIWESAATAHPPHQSRSADIPTTQLAMWSLLKVVCIHADFTTNRPIDWAITTLCKPFRSTELCPIRRTPREDLLLPSAHIVVFMHAWNRYSLLGPIIRPLAPARLVNWHQPASSNSVASTANAMPPSPPFGKANGVGHGQGNRPCWIISWWRAR